MSVITRIKHISRLMLTVAAIVTAGTASGAQSNIQMGDAAYNKKNYDDALIHYTAALQQDGVSSDLYYNLGNTYYRKGNLGQAILNYKRALALNPANDDAHTNLEFVKTQIADKPEDDSTFLSNLHQRILSQMTPDAWAWTAFAVFLTMMTAVALYMFGANVLLRKVGFFGGFILLVAFAYTLIIAFQSARGLEGIDTAVVTAPTTNLRSEPATSNSKTDKVVPLHEGTELQIIDSLSTPDDPATPLWYNVKINNTTRAWVSAADVERV